MMDVRKALELKDYERAVRLLRFAGFSKIQSMAFIASVGEIGLGDAKVIVHQSSTWRDVRARDDELHRMLDEEWDDE